MTSSKPKSNPEDAENDSDIHDARVVAPRPDRRTDAQQASRTQEFVIQAAHHLMDLHCTDVIVFDVRNLSDLTDYIILATGTSDRQIRSVSRDLEKVAQEYDLEKFGRDIDQNANWVVTDYVEVIVHLFEPAARAHYDLEMMWNDAPRISYNDAGHRHKNRPPGRADEPSQDAASPSEE